MNSPFIYGRIAVQDSFTDREEDTESLRKDFLNLTNTILISPRRWGKSSLVRRAGDLAVKSDPNLRICYLDIFNVRTEDEFYEKLAESVIKCTSTKFEEIFSTAMRYATALIPSFTAGDNFNTFSLEFKMKQLSKSADDILDMAEKIAVDKGIKIIICIDEFQQIANFDNPEAFQAKLRSHWQLHQHVAYCLYGSRRHMMIEVFTHREKPFFKFGKVMFLEKIDPEKWIPFITEKFCQTGKSITPNQCKRIVELVDNNPYYIQQLSEEVWNRTEQKTPDEAIEEAFQAIVRSQAGLNLALTQTLTITQQNLLNAIVNGKKELSSQAVMEQYGLKNSLTVQRAKKALIKMDIIDNFGKVVSLEDPIYAWWLKHVYFS